MLVADTVVTWQHARNSKRLPCVNKTFRVANNTNVFQIRSLLVKEVSHRHCQQCRRRSEHISSMNAIVALSKYCPLGVNTTIELKNITATSDDSGTILVESYPARCHYYKMRLLHFELNYINSKWAVFGLCHYYIM